MSSRMTPEMRSRISSKLKGRTTITENGRARLSKSRMLSASANRVDEKDWSALTLREISEKYSISYGSLCCFRLRRNKPSLRGKNASGTTSGTLISPSGSTVAFSSISQLCIRFNLRHSGVSRLISGKFRSYRGWTKLRQKLEST